MRKRALPRALKLSHKERTPVTYHHIEQPLLSDKDLIRAAGQYAPQSYSPHTYEGFARNARGDAYSFAADQNQAVRPVIRAACNLIRAEAAWTASPFIIPLERTIGR